MAKKILIVASNPNVQRELEQILQAVENIEVTVTAHGNEVLGLATRLKPALVLVDVQLAEGSGYEVCRQIKRSFAGVSVILISSSAAPFDWKEAAVAGADSRLSVPFEHPEVALDRIHRYLSEYGGRKSAGRMSSETRLVLDLMTHRANSILWAELARRLLPGHIDYLSGEVGSAIVDGAELRSYFTSLMHDESIASGISTRLLSELPPLLWIELMDQLVEKGSCDFDDVGRFTKVFEGIRAGVSFRASGTLKDGKTPRMEYLADSATQLAMRACLEELTPGLVDPIGERSYTIGTLALALPRILDWLNGQPVVVELDLAADRDSAPYPWRRDWLSIRARAFAHATFYAYLNESKTLLYRGQEVAVETIGVLVRPSNTDFVASQGLLSILETNPIVQSASG